MKTVKVNLGQRSYNIYIGKNIIEKLWLLTKITPHDVPLFVVTNNKVNTHYGEGLKKALRPISKKIMIHEVPDTEKAKSFPVYVKTIRKLARFATNTRPIVIAFGGGVTGDLTGFVASAYRRGVPYIQIPTTLLAQVDSAIGGKVAIDIKEAKNIVGNFYQPKMVLCDLRFLRTLPKREIQNGLVEIVKYGIIKDKKLFSYIERNLKQILTLDEKVIEHIIYKSCSIKARVVETDEFDTKDHRAILNFGHTLGHAIETASSYRGSMAHGQAVAMGMVMASLIAVKLELLSKKNYEKIFSLVNKISAKTSTRHIKLEDVMTALSYDKKFIYGVNRFILPTAVGHVRIVDQVPNSIINNVVKNCIRR
ncbi:MAG: 3-dehydroquinate synthase [Candidatus Omnitrophota bacterium]